MQWLASGVSIIACGKKAGRRGFTASAVMSLSDDPPSLVVAVGRLNRAHDAMLSLGRFTVNVLSQSQRLLADRFAGRETLFDEARFQGDDWQEGEHEAPTLRGALAVFACEVAESHPFRTHTLVIGRILAISAPPGPVATAPADASQRPLLYWRRRYATLDPGED